jgi:hypothetical protein
MVAAFAAPGTLPQRSGDVTRVDPDVRRGGRQRLSDFVQAFCDALRPTFGLL